MHIVGETMDGTHAELIAVPRDFVHPIPGDLSFEEAAAFPLVFETAYRMLVHARAAAGGRVGADLGHRRRRRDRGARDREGARRATSSSRRRATRSSRGRASSAPTRRSTTRPATSSRRVKEVTGGGAHVVVDDVGEATWKRTLDAARAEGRIVVCGATTGPNPPAALHRVWWKQLSILGSTMGTPDDFQARLRPDRRRQGAAGRRQRVPARRGARPRTSGSRPASSSARSCSRSRARRQRAGGDGRGVAEPLPRGAAAEHDAYRAQRAASARARRPRRRGRRPPGRGGRRRARRAAARRATARSRRRGSARAPCRRRRRPGTASPPSTPRSARASASSTRPSSASANARARWPS